MIYQVKVENKDYYCFVNQLRTKGCLQKKKLHMEGHCPNLILPPPPPSKVGTNIEGTFFGLWTPLPPFKSREIC